MSKTIDLQIEKVNSLIKGLNNNAAEMAKHGITSNDIAEMVNLNGKLTEANKECDAIRAQLSEKVKAMNITLILVKKRFQEIKRMIKNNYPQEDWAKYGVMDKR